MKTLIYEIFRIIEIGNEDDSVHTIGISSSARFNGCHFF
jgi:hypothetical protein